MAMIRTTEIRFPEFCVLFEIEQALAKGLQLRMAQIVLAYNLICVDIN